MNMIFLTKPTVKTLLNTRFLTICTTRLKKQLRLPLVVGLSVLLLSGCSYFQPYKAPLTQGNVMTQEAVSALQAGLNKNQVRELLGPPMAKNPFNPNYWEYIFYSKNTELHADSARHLAILFDQDGMLESWKMRDKTITLKEDNRFLGLNIF